MKSKNHDQKSCLSSRYNEIKFRTNTYQNLSKEEYAISLYNEKRNVQFAILKKNIYNLIATSIFFILDAQILFLLTCIIVVIL